MLVIKRFVCFILLSFAFSARGTISIGEAVPNGTYNAYASTGNHYKINIYRDLDNSSFENIYLSYGLQYIYFGENIVQNNTWGGTQIREGERSLMFDVGLKYIKSDGLFGDGLFRPYVNGAIGLGFFKQYTVYDYPNTYDPCGNSSIFDIDSFMDIILLLLFDMDDDECEPEWDDNEEYVTRDRLTSPYFSLELGGLLYPSANPDIAIDIGIQYNIISRIDKIEYTDFDSNDIPEVFDDIGRVIDADYHTVYIGISWLLN